MKGKTMGSLRVKRKKEGSQQGVKHQTRSRKARNFLVTRPTAISYRYRHAAVNSTGVDASATSEKYKSQDATLFSLATHGIDTTGTLISSSARPVLSGPYSDSPALFDACGNRVRMYSRALSGLSSTLPGPLRT